MNVHLSIALLLRERSGLSLTLLTHGQRMPVAARNLGFAVEGA